MARRFSILLACLMVFSLTGGNALLAQTADDPPSKPEQEAKATKKAKDATEEKLESLRHAEEVTVTATRVETEKMKTPVAVTTLDQDQLDRKGIQSVKDLANMVPNMDISTINGQSTPIISLRGVRSTNETELGDPAVGVHLDGVYSPRMQGMLGLMFDNERVEVLRGPQGTLFGRNSTVGSVNIVSAKPDTTGYDSRVNLSLGSFNSREVQAMFNMPVGETFAVRVAGRFHERDSYLNGFWDPNQYDQRHIRDFVGGSSVIAPGSFGDCTGPNCASRTQHSNWWIDWADGGADIRSLVAADRSNFYNDADEWAYRASALWKPLENLSFQLSYQQYRNDSAGGIDLVNCEKLRGRPVRDAGGAITGTADCSTLFPKDDTYQAVVNVPGKLLLEIGYLRGIVNWDLTDDLRFVYLGGAEDQNRESAQDMEQSLNAWDGAMFFLPGTGSNSSSHEVQLQSSGPGRFDWIAGANTFYEKTATAGYYDNPINDKAFWLQPDRSTDAWSVFGQGTFELNRKLHLTAGVRHSDETKQDKGGRTYICNNDNGCAPGWWSRGALNKLPANYFNDPSKYPSFTANDNKGSWDHNDWRVGVDYQLNDNSLLYSYLATGFKSGGIGDVFHQTNPRTNEEINVRTAFGPEEVTTLELGFKNRLLGGALNLSGAYFYSDYENMQYASVGAIAMTDRWQVLMDAGGMPILDDKGQPVFGWVAAPIIAYFTQNVPGARIQGLELEYDWTPYAGGRVSGYASWLDTEITEDWITKWNYDAVAYFGINYEQSVDPTNELLKVNLKGNEMAVSPPFKLNLRYEHAFDLGRRGAIVPWVNVHWEDASYLTIWNVDKHTDDMKFVIRDEDIRYTDDRRESFYTVDASVRYYRNNWFVEAFGYNLTDKVVQYWGGAAEGVAKGSFSTPRTYGVRLQFNL